MRLVLARDDCANLLARNDAPGSLHCFLQERGAPFREQNCLGTTSPRSSVVRVESRVPSPAASTIAQVPARALIDSLHAG